MGNIITYITRRTIKPIKDYNLEARIDRVIIKEKPDPAPLHITTKNIVEKHSSAEMKKDILEENQSLKKMLQQVYVTSKGDNPVIDKHLTNKALPLNRSNVEEPMYGYHEPKKVPYGKITLKNVLELISKHQEDSEKYTAETLALEYQLDTVKTEQLLKYFKTFTLVIPEEAKPISDEGPSPLLLGAHSVIRMPKKDSKYLEENPPTSTT